MENIQDHPTAKLLEGIANTQGQSWNIYYLNGNICICDNQGDILNKINLLNALQHYNAFRYNA